MAGLAPVERAIENVSTEIEALAEQDDSCQRLTAFQLALPNLVARR
jgi:hypothetical protein